MSQSSDQELIAQLQKGDLEALGLLYDRHRQMVFRTALAISGDPEAASDLLQDVFLRLYRFADHVDQQRPLEPWLYRMTANLSYTYVKRNRRWLRPLEDLADWLIGSSKYSPADLAEKNDDWEQVQRAVLDLPAAQRVVVVLYYLNDLSLMEISDILAVPMGTIKSRLHYGRQALKKNLGLGRFAEGDGMLDLNYDRP
ncbi:MAG: RNA polymerase sigma factor [Anaerolineales bacterium]|nr:RNA polymerase sigma factor [Anaerolineales bacterium]